MSLKVSDVLVELDGEGIIMVNDEESEKALADMGLSPNSIIISYTETNTIRNGLFALRVLALDKADEFLENLADAGLEALGE